MNLFNIIKDRFNVIESIKRIEFSNQSLFDSQFDDYVQCINNNTKQFKTVFISNPSLFSVLQYFKRAHEGIFKSETFKKDFIELCERVLYDSV